MFFEAALAALALVHPSHGNDKAEYDAAKQASEDGADNGCVGLFFLAVRSSWCYGHRAGRGGFLVGAVGCWC